ncbi:hypothetical protein E2C01_017640 [Portunus trituberculatus]|uniref:Uncharacterized protein n=1 Tax=Portunus trituberculatus TaxID=210409 RepID=A0A5B7DU24_PORTR|nr:hypothetical protein [Portunus trituberculatus]
MSSSRGGRPAQPSRLTRPSRRSSASPSGKLRPSSHSAGKASAGSGVKGDGNTSVKPSVSSGPCSSVRTGDGAAARRSPAALASPQVTGSPKKTVKASSTPSPELKISTSMKAQALTQQRRARLQAQEKAPTSSQEDSSKQRPKRHMLQHQGSSSDLSKSRSVSPDSQRVPALHKGEWESSSDQSRSSTPDGLRQQCRRRLVKQSSSSDDPCSERFDILWRLRTDDLRKESPLAGTPKNNASSTLKQHRLNGTGRQYSLDSVLASPETPQLSLKSMLSLCRNSGGDKRGSKLKRQKEVCVEEEGDAETFGPGGRGAWPSLTVTHSSPVDSAPSSPATNTGCNGQKVKSHSLDRDKDNDWESELLQVLDANAVSASSSPCTTPDGRRPSLLRRLKSLSRVSRQKAVNDDYGKGKHSPGTRQ